MNTFSTLLLLALVVAASAKSFVSPPKDITTILSKKFKGARISYKEVANICEITDGVNSYSGYVHLPSCFVPDAGGAKGLPKNGSASYFFWYFPARDNPESAPTAMYFGGGPGYSGFDGSSVFPCYFNPDSNSTTLNKHSWNNHVNMLYIDNPLGVGFSYTTLANGTLDTLTNTFKPVHKHNRTTESITDIHELEEIDLTKIPATMHVTDPSTTINGTMAAARTVWRFSQVWFNEFPEYRTKNNNISIWEVSYTGFYATMFTAYFLEQNELIKSRKHEIKEATVLNMATVGIINGVTDIEAMALGWLDYARNNTYDHPIINETSYFRYDNVSSDMTTNAEHKTRNIVALSLIASQYNPFDISVEKPGAFPYEYEAAFFNQQWVQQELGVPLNYTRGNDAFPGVFFEGTGDPARYDLSHLGNILDKGLNVALVSGDRDYRCNWFSVENASLHIPFHGAKYFANSGYADIVTNSSYNGGLVREHGGLSFSRVYQAGHSAGGFQPETVSRIFERAMFRKDVATGEVELDRNHNYQSNGKTDVRNVKNNLPAPIDSVCYVLQPADTCTEEQKAALVNGTAETKDWVVTSPEGFRNKAGQRRNSI
ncbi:unnamed protein product [Fusarium equiseti]|uniref:Uncharacterized protein n=1 Tax=Fusarium equiseti TaxID=61235 RepID=A0A8J2N9V8_FUSEQ|nr:unnamed protein product [Fusarium equiseti]